MNPHFGVLKPDLLNATMPSLRKRSATHVSIATGKRRDKLRWQLSETPVEPPVERQYDLPPGALQAQLVSEYVKTRR